MPKNTPFLHHLRFRQVHLDFHTSPLIPGIGSRFSKRQFQEALKVGRINSITIFSKCHHGLSYHPTKVGTQHPRLKFDLLARQIEACREINVRCPIYISAGIDEVSAGRHPDWVIKKRDGSTFNPLEARFKIMRWCDAYLDYLCAQIEEVVDRWPDNDGIFLDIIHSEPDYTDEAMFAMRGEGLDPEKEDDVAKYAQERLLNYYTRATAACRKNRADTPVFHNSGHIAVGADRFWRTNSQLEMESLPTGGWGYDHFPVSARYAITTGMDFMGMTGKFHTTWGEFGGFKRSNALRYECGAMLAYGAKCSVGDQLHPNGEMNLDTYRLIGSAYEEVERKEPWCDHVSPVARIAIVSAERNQDRARGPSPSGLPDEGAARMLFELHLPFLVLDENAAWDGFDLVVIPDNFIMTPAFQKKASSFLKKGGRLLAAGSSLVDPDGKRFAIDPGARLLGRSTNDPDYLMATDLTPDVAVKSAIMIQGGAYQIAPARGTRVLVNRRESYFNRTWEHFCSHQHTPDALGEVSPAAILTPRIAYFAHDIFSKYRTYGQPLYRDFVAAALRHLFIEGLPAETTLPTGGRFNILEQKGEKRYVAHVLYAPTRPGGSIWGKPIEIIEDAIPIHNARVRVRVPRRITGARLVPEGKAIPFAQKGDLLTFTVPEFTAHQMIELSYATKA
jgi:Hypothetical glycosyl hydrolase 6